MGLTSTVKPVPSSTIPKGTVVSSDPAAGIKVAQGTSVTLTVSSGVANVLVPSVAGLGQIAAGNVLGQAGLTTGNSDQPVLDPVRRRPWSSGPILRSGPRWPRVARSASIVSTGAPPPTTTTTSTPPSTTTTTTPSTSTTTTTLRASNRVSAPTPDGTLEPRGVPGLLSGCRWRPGSWTAGPARSG